MLWYPSARMFRFTLFTLCVALLGCTGADFPVATSSEPEGETDTKTSPDDASDSASEAAVDSATDTATDTGDAASETATDSDACVPNACGGCGPLTGTVGAACGGCGKYVCSTDGSKLDCNDPGKNACGGCAVLGAKPGDGCPSCGGVMKCNGVDALICESTAPKNSCGGCSVLPVPAGTACGKCNSGLYKCMGTDATACDDPEATKPALGTKCGACGGAKYECVGGSVKCNDAVVEPPGKMCGACNTSKYVCNAAGTATSCANPADTNLCGGCKALAAAPTTPCGACSAGKYGCDGIDAVKCAEATFTPVPPGTSCGTCNTSSYLCDVGATTKCASPDDRKTGLAFDAAPSDTYTVFAPYWSPYSTTKTNAVLTSVSYYLRYRAPSVLCPGGTATSCSTYGCELSCTGGPCTCKPVAGWLTDGPLELQVRRDAADGAVVATVTLNTNMVPASGGWVTFSTWSPAAPTLTAGATYYLIVQNKGGEGLRIDAADSPTGLPTEYFLTGKPPIAARIELKACGL